MTTTDQFRNALRDLEAKAKEMELDKKLTAFADQADQYLHRAATKAGNLAQENRERIDEQLVRAGGAVDGKTDGKYASYVEKVRDGVMTGVDWVADQRGPASPGAGTAGGAEPAAGGAESAAEGGASTTDEDVSPDGPPPSQ